MYPNTPKAVGPARNDKRSAASREAAKVVRFALFLITSPTVGLTFCRPFCAPSTTFARGAAAAAPASSTVARVVAVIFMWGRLVAAVFVGVAAAVVGCMHPAAGIAEEDGEDSADGNRRERACVSAVRCHSEVPGSEGSEHHVASDGLERKPMMGS